MKKQEPGFLLYLLPGMGDILWLGVFWGAIGLGSKLLNVDGDLGRHLTIGQYILGTGTVPVRDLFSHTMLGQPLTPHEWLSQALFASVYRWLGLDSVVLLCGLIIATTFWLVFHRSRQECGSLLPAVLATVLAIATSSLHWLARPHIFTFLMLALWVIALDDLRRGRLKNWWRLPVIMLVWVNFHGAFIAGFITWAIYAAGLGWDIVFRRFLKGQGLHGHFWRYFFLGGAAAWLASLINPAGFGVWQVSFGYIGNNYLVGHTVEYFPPNFHNPSTWPFLLFIGLLVMVLGLQNKKIEGAHLFMTASWLLMALYSLRNAPLFAIVSAPLLASGIEDLLYHNPHRMKLLNRMSNFDTGLSGIDTSLKGIIWPIAGGAIAVAAFYSGASLDFQRQGNAFSSKVFPVEAVNWLESHPQAGKMFNYFPWGGYILYRQWPEQRVFIDGQTDFYGEALTRQYEQVITLSPGWEDVLARYQVDWVILPPAEAAARALKSSLEWQVVYEDDVAVVMIRRE